MKGLNDEIQNFWTIEKSFVNRKKKYWQAMKGLFHWS